MGAFLIAHLQCPFLLRSASLHIRRWSSLATLLTLSPFGQIRSYHCYRISDLFHPCSSKERTTVRQSHRIVLPRSTTFQPCASAIRQVDTASRGLGSTRNVPAHHCLNLCGPSTQCYASCAAIILLTVVVKVTCRVQLQFSLTLRAQGRPLMPSVSQIWRHAAA